MRARAGMGKSLAALSGILDSCPTGDAARAGGAARAQWMRNDENVSLQALPTHGVSLVKVQRVPPKLPSV